MSATEFETLSPEDKAFFAEMDYFDSFAEENGLKTRWSISGIKFDDALPEEMTNGITFLEYNTYVFDQDYNSREVGMKGVFNCKTWGDLYKMADNTIMKSGDHHHIFIEAFERDSTRSNCLNLHTGS